MLHVIFVGKIIMEDGRMKKFMTTFFVLFSLVLFAQSSQKIEFGDAWNSQGFALESESGYGVTVNYSIENFTLSQENIEGQLQHVISLPGNFLPNDEGMPNLPGNGRYIAIPQNARAELRIVD